MEVYVSKIHSVYEKNIYETFFDYYDEKNDIFSDVQINIEAKDEFNAVRTAMRLAGKSKYEDKKCFHVTMFDGNGNVIMDIEKDV